MAGAALVGRLLRLRALDLGRHLRQRRAASERAARSPGRPGGGYGRRLRAAHGACAARGVRRAARVRCACAVRWRGEGGGEKGGEACLLHLHAGCAVEQPEVLEDLLLDLLEVLARVEVLHGGVGRHVQSEVGRVVPG